MMIEPEFKLEIPDQRPYKLTKSFFQTRDFGHQKSVSFKLVAFDIHWPWTDHKRLFAKSNVNL